MSTDPRDVRSLIRRARDGDGDALAQLLGGYRNYMCFMARAGLDSVMRPKADASDVAQETLLRAFEKFDGFRGETEAELTAWLRKVLATTLSNMVRRYRGTAARRLDRERSLEQALDDSSLALAGIVPARGPSPSQGAETHERSVLLADALARLSEDQRRAVVLRTLKQLTWAEVGEQMDRSPEAARMLWGRAMKALGGHAQERG